MTKLGIYYAPAHDRPGDWQYMSRLNPPVVRILMPGATSTELVSRVHRTAPNARLALRWWNLDDGGEGNKRGKLNNPDVSAANDAREYAVRVERMEREAQANGLPFPTRRTLLVNALNEPPTWEHDKRPAIVAYNRRLILDLRAHGIPTAALCLAVGHPEEWPPKWDWAQEVADYVRASPGSVIELHSYWQLEGPNFVWTDSQGNERKDWGALAGRYIHCPFNVPILIGECGADGRLYGRRPNHTGWRGNISAAQYAEQLRFYLTQIQRDSRIIAALPFLTDYQDGQSWASFDTADAHNEILAMVQSLPVAPPPVVTPPLPPPPVEPPPPSIATKLIVPTQGIVSQRWGENPAAYARFGIPGHNGLDFAAPAGTPVKAVADGIVAWVGDDPDYGLYVRVTHRNLGIDSFYAHLHAQMVGVGQTVKQGDMLGMVGSTGNSTGPHLHLELRASHLGHYQDIAPGYSRGRFNPEVAYWLWDRVRVG